MTLELADGRGELFQWDAGRIIEFGDDTVSQAHFTSIEKITDIPYTIVVKNRKAAIPDELLQVPGTLIVYAWVSDTNGGYTKVQVNFPVFARPKPADYVYTPTEHAGFDRLRTEIGNLSALKTDAKDNLVAAINEVARTGGGAGSMGFRAADGYIQYSTDGGSTWTNLIAVADLKGADGAQGAKGDTGATGPQGQKGDPGEKGDPGATGPAGPAGTPGKDGNSPVVTATKSGRTTTISVDGAAIATVEDGADGAPGKDGTDGKPGPAGTPGKDGANGETGPAGPQGLKGADGITPHIGDNGNWYLGATDTGKPSRGEKGEKGDTGAAGSRGEAGPQGAPGKDGVDGKPGATGADGVTPHIGDNGHWYIGSTDTGKPSRGVAGAKGSDGANGKDGAQGEKGADGKTPIRGTDYWTAADKQEIVNDVLAALPDGTEVSY